MCHCCIDVEALDAEEKREVLESHSRAELAAELGEDGLAELEAAV